MKKILPILLFLLLSVSCSFSPMEGVTVSPYSDTPWEEVTGKEMWYKVVWFDGRDVHIKYLDRGVWSFETEVLSSSLSVFVFL